MKTHQPNRDMRNDDQVAGDDKVAGDLKTRMDKIKATYIHEKNEKNDWPTGPATDFILSWETFFMKIALTSKERSTHPEYRVKTIPIASALSLLLQVGACVVSQYNQVMSVGYNAYPEDMTFLTTVTQEKEESAYS